MRWYGLSSPARMMLVILGWMLVSIVCTPLSVSAEEPVWPVVELKQIVSGVHELTDIQNAGDGSGRLFIAQQRGQIRILKNGALLGTPFLDIGQRITSGGEIGLLGMAFPPNYAIKKHFYVFYSRKGDGATLVSRFRVSSNPDVADPASEQVLLVIPQSNTNHKGGQLAFGPDGLLYIAVGDDGMPGDHSQNAQDLTKRQGKILRIDVESTPPEGSAYRIPPSNPFATHATNAREILFWGLRNPWRFSFDAETGDLFIADVGEDRKEEVNVIPSAQINAGGNFGWPLKEGTLDYDNPEETNSGLIAPVFEYDRVVGKSIIGGRVYRGANPRLTGFYFFGDNLANDLWVAASESGTWKTVKVPNTLTGAGTFGVDEAGELYIGEHYGGRIFKIEASDQMPPPVYSPAAGTYSTEQNVRIAAPIPGAVVHYTTDGSEPGASSPVLSPNAQIRISGPATIKARAFRSDLLPSAVVEATYQLQCAAIQYTGPSGTQNDYTSVQLSVTTPGAEIRYTTNGSAPDVSSTLYVPGQSIPITKTTTIKAQAFRPGWLPSIPFSATVFLQTTAPALFSQWTALHEPVHLLSNTPGATIHYTTDGSTPTTASPIWSGPLDLPTGTVIRAIAVKGEMSVSLERSFTVARFAPENAKVVRASTGISSVSDVVKLDDRTVFAVGDAKVWKVVDAIPTLVYEGSPFGKFTGVTLTRYLELAFVGAGSGLYTLPAPAYSGTPTFIQLPSVGYDVIQAKDTSLVVASAAAHKIIGVAAASNIYTIAGTGVAGNQDGPALQATFNQPIGIARGPEGELYIAEGFGRRIRKIGTDRIVSTYAGTGESGWRDGTASQAQFADLLGIAADRIGNVYVSDSTRIRKIRPDGMVTTFRGPLLKVDGVTLEQRESFGLGARGLDVDENGVLYFGGPSGVFKLIQDDWDNDGIPDEAERTLGAPYVVGVDDRNVDTDADGHTNAAEWVAGTEPHSTGRSPGGVSTRKEPDGTFHVVLPATSGRQYQLEYTDDLVTWKPMGEPFQAQSKSFTVSDKFSPLVPKRFYRIRELP